MDEPTPTDKVMVRLRDVTKTYANGIPSLRGVSMDLLHGGFLFVTGPSGAGKSTLLKLLYGEERADGGEIVVDGVNVRRLRGDKLSRFRRRIGVVFQDYKLIPRRTVAENIVFVLQAQGLDDGEIRRRLMPTLKLVGLEDKAQVLPEQLSGGEQQRISLARAIVGTPRLILADEPTGNLDPANASQVLRILQKLNDYGATVIVSTHDQSLLANNHYPVAQLRHGRLHIVRT